MTAAHKTLEQLEKDIWPEPDYPSHLVTTCHRLRKVPIRDFTPEDFRIMIGQQIGLTYLLPPAIELLKAEPLAAGDFYPGDLLIAVLRVPTSKLEKATRRDLADICRAALSSTVPRLTTERRLVEASLAAL